MNDIAIRVKNLSKRYRIGLEEEVHETLVGYLSSYLKRPLRNLHKLRRLTRFSEGEGFNGAGCEDVIWALRDVSFEVQRGQVVGIIGRNGAGKSTLLKILSRITVPTSGRVELYGRVSSLLEVGTGFHAELAGRENIYLNGTILGMTKAEIDKKFDEIVDFAAIGKFLDTPVKRYSSGMRMRLAFSVAAHLEPEILLIDEVLAVGDVEFQKKCLGKMRDVSREGRTVLFVSHNMGAINRLCQRCMLFAEGQLAMHGAVRSVTSEYLDAQNDKRAIIDTRESRLHTGTGEGYIAAVAVLDKDKMPTTVIGIGQPFSIRLELKMPFQSTDIVVGLDIKQLDGLQVAHLRSDSQGILLSSNSDSKRLIVNIDVPGLPLYPGTYVIEPWFAFHRGRRVDQLHGELLITLQPSGMYASESKIIKGRGIILVDCQWHSQQVEAVP